MKKTKISDLSGFSLIEVLIATSIIITMTTIVVAILTSSFKTSSKATSLDIVRQNGNNATDQLSRLIKFSFFIGATNDIDSGFASCPVKSADPNQNRFSYIKISSDGEKTISCSNSGITINNEPLLDSNRVSVVPGSCKLTCFQDRADVSPVIGINFDLTYGNTPNPTLLPEKRATIHFSTSIKARNR